MIKSNKRTKRVLLGVAVALLISVLALTGAGVFFKLKDDNKIVPTNPLDWSVDTWDGASIGSEEYLADYGNRGNKTITIESASSFMYFVNQVNNGKDYRGYTIYLNSNIDLNGNTIDSIGNENYPFNGVFDGSYYTIMNAKVNGDGLFGYTQESEIRNLGVYNVSVNSVSNYVGGLVGTATNTTIKNSFVRLGSVKGANYVGGLVGLFNSEDGVNNILNCFTDTSVKGLEVGGLVGKVKTMDSGESLSTIQESYYVSQNSPYAVVENPQYYISNLVRKVSTINDFASWNYNKDYSKGTRWTDYAYAENSTKLDFNYPILNEFVKVYTKGSCYENVVYNELTGRSESVTSLSEAVAKADKNSKINIIVDKVTVDNALELTEGANLKITATKDTTIVKGENVENLFVGNNNSNIVIGSEDSDAKIILEGNKLSTGALIKTNGSNVTIHKNVVLKNNTNANGNGGAIHIVNDEATPLSTSLKEVTIDKDVTITNCTANKGGAIYVEGNVNLSIGNNIYGNNASVGKDIYFANKSVVTLTEDLTNNLSIYMEGLKPYEETGRRNFDLSSIAVSGNIENDIKYLKLENDLKTTSLLSENCISAYKGTKYNITYNTDGGKHNNPSTYTCVDNVILGEATKPGYIFLGWKEVLPETQLISNLEDEYSEEITIGSLGDKEYVAEYQASDLVYTLSSDGTYYIVGNNTSYTGTSVNIPATYAGLPVKEISNSAFKSNTTITSITIGENITKINSYAFRDCKNIATINYNAVKCADLSSSNYAFYYVGDNLSSVTLNIGDNVTYIPGYIFNPYSSYSMKIKTINWGTGVVSIGKYAFSRTSITSVTIPEGVTSIATYAFSYCSSITSVTLPESLTAIGSHAFNACTAIKTLNYNAIHLSNLGRESSPFSQMGTSSTGVTVNIGVNVKSIPEGLFEIYSSTDSNWPKITKVVFAGGCKCERIGAYAFGKIKSLTSVKFVETEGWVAGSTLLSSVDLSNTSTAATYLTNTYVGHVWSWPKSDNPEYVNYVLSEDESYYIVEGGRDVATVETLVIPDSYNGLPVKEIADYAFYYCTGLKSVSFGQNITTIGKYAFANCSSLLGVTIGENVESLGNQAFSGCTSLLTIDYNTNKITALSGKCFEGDGVQTVFNVGVNVVNIPEDMVSSSKVVTVNILGDVKIIGKYAFAYSTLKNINFENISALEEICASAFLECQQLEEFDFKNAVNLKKIENVAFERCVKLQNIDLSNCLNLITIGNFAFRNCNSLTTVTLSPSITQLNPGLFYNCTKLETVNYNVTNSVDPRNSDQVFYNAGTSGDGITLNIADNVKTIPANMLYVKGGGLLGTAKPPKIIAVNIGSGVTRIGANAFADVTTITSVTFSNAEGWTAGSTALNESNLANPSTAVTYLTSTYVAVDWTREGAEPEYVAYTLSDDGTYYIASKGADIDSCTDLVIADTCEGLPVKEIAANAFKDITTFTSLTIGANVEIIGESAFYGCSGLTEINFNATNITNVIVDVFSNAGADGLVVNIANGITAIPDRLFYSSNISYPCNVQTVNIPTSVTTIGASAFRNCTNLTNAIMPSSVTTIKEYAFYSCRSLTSITIPESVTMIEKEAFTGCYGITEINFNAIECEDFGEVGFNRGNFVSNAFGRLSNSTPLVLNVGAKVTRIPSYFTDAEYCYYKDDRYPMSYNATSTKISQINFADNSACTSIGNSAFIYSSVEVINWGTGSKLKTIESNAFVASDGKNNLTNITIPATVSQIGAYAFSGQSITSVTFENPNGWTAGSTAISSSNLANASTAASYLKQYYSKTWTREDLKATVTFIGPDGEITDGSIEADIRYELTTYTDEDYGECNGVIIYFGSSSFTESYKDRVKNTKVEIIVDGSQLWLSCCNGALFGSSPSSWNFTGDSGDYEANTLALYDGFASEDVLMYWMHSWGESPIAESIEITYYIDVEWIDTVTEEVTSDVTFKVNGYYDSQVSATFKAYGESTMSYVLSIDFTLGNLFIDGSVIDSSLVQSTTIQWYAYAGESLEHTKTINGLPTTEVFYDYYLSYYGYTAVVTFTLKPTVEYEIVGAPEENFSGAVYVYKTIDEYESGQIDSIIQFDFTNVICAATGKSIPIKTVELSIYSINVVFDRGWSESVHLDRSIFTYEGDVDTFTMVAIDWGDISIDLLEAKVVFQVDSGVSYDTSSGSYAVAKADSDTIANFTTIEIASEYNGLSVKQVGSFTNATNLQKVILPSTIETINDNAFKGCTDLNTINIPASVQKIGKGAFSGCSSLTSDSKVTIANRTGWTYTSSSTNTAGTAIDSLTAHGLTDTYATYYLNVDQLKNFVFTLVENGNDDYYSVRASSTSITNAIIPASYNNLPVRVIEANGFKDCTSLTTVTIPSSITMIGNYAFSGCTALLTLNYNGTVADGSIKDENYIFANAGKTSKSLVVYIGDNVTVIPSYMFCTIFSTYTSQAVIKKVVFGVNSNLTTLGYACFRYADVYEINLENCSKLTTISADAFRGCQKIANIYIPKNVTTLGQNSFGWCPALKSVTYDAINCTTYYHNAFSKNNNATDKISVSFGPNVEYIPHNFDYSSDNSGNIISHFTITTLDLTGLNVKSIGNYAFYQNTSITTVKLNEGLQDIGMYAFSYCSNITTLILPSDMNWIGGYAFYYCTGISGTLTVDAATIGYDAFYNCTNITGLIFGDNIITISNAFESCKNIATVSIGKNVTTINFHFNNLPNLTSISVDNENTNFVMDDGVLYSYDKTTLIYYPRYKSDTSFVIPDSVTAVGAYAVCNNQNLTRLTISENVESIGGSAFSGLKYLTELKYNAINNKSYDSYYTYNYLGTSSTGVHLIIGDSVEVIPSRFMDIIWSTSNFSYKITSLTIGKNVKTIGMNAFAGHTTIKTINYNATNLTSHGGAVFGGTGASGSVVNIGNNVERIPAGLFNYDAGSVMTKKQNKFSKVNIPASVKEIGSGAFKNCSALTTATFENTSNWYVYSSSQSATPITISSSSNGATLLKSTYSSYTWINTEELPDLKYTLVENGDDDYYKVSAFRSDLTSVTIPSIYNGLEVRCLGYQAFLGCDQLTSVVIPNTITTIQGEAFAGCSSLTSVTLPNTITAIYARTFKECTSLTSITIPDSVITIFEYAFSYCTSLTSITIPDSVKTIYDYAFSYCSSLRSVILGESLTAIGVCDFEGCENLTSVDFGENYQNWIYANDRFSGGSFVDLNAYDLSNPTRAAKALTEIYVNNYLYKDDYYAFEFVAQYTDSKITHYYVKAKDGLIKWIYNANIPAEYNGKPVTGIMDNGFKDRPNISIVVIPSTITYIGNYSFSGCTGIETIYYNAIECDDLGVYNNAFTDAGKSGVGITVIVDKDVKVIPSYLFCPTGDSGETQTGLPKVVKIEFDEDNELTTIGEYAFRYLIKLESINLEDCNKLTTIGTYAFRGNPTLTSITIPENVTYIGDGAFSWLINLSEINYKATNVADLYNPSSSIFAEAGSTLVAAGGNLDLIIAENVTNIPAHFSGGNTGVSFTRIIGLSNVSNHIGDYAFKNCNIYTEIIGNLEINAKYVGEQAFARVKGIENLTIGKDVKYIGNKAFAELNNLSSINYNAEDVDNYEYLNITDDTLLDNYYAVMESEGYSRYDYDLINPQLLRGVEMENRIFNNAGVLSENLVLNIGADVVHIPAYIFNSSIYESGSPNIKSINWDEAANVKTIGQNAFRWLTQLTEITIPETIEEMGGFAFYENMNVKTVNFLATNMKDMQSHGYDDHEKLWYTGNYAFHNLGKYNLTETTDEFGETTTFTGEGVTVNIGANVTRIPAHMFHSTKSIYPYAPRITNVNWGENSGVTTIGEYAFHNCGYLTSIVIPENVTTLGNFAFANAYHARSLTIKSSKITGLGAGPDIDGDGIGDGNNIFASLGGKIVSATNNVVSGECELIFDFLTGVEQRNNHEYVTNNYYIIPDYLMYCTAGMRPRITKVSSYQEEQKFNGIGKYAFYKCYCLVTFEDWDQECVDPHGDYGYSFGNIGDYAFYECKALRYGDNGKDFAKGNFAYIGSHAFAYCDSLQLVDISSCSLGEGAFRNCSGLTSIKYVPKYLYSIGNSAFRWCTNVTELVFGYEGIEEYNFDGVYAYAHPLDNYIYFGLGNDTDGVDVTYYSGPYLPDNVFYPSVDQGGGIRIKSLTLGDDLQVIGENALRGVQGLKELTIPENVTTIGINAFNNMRDVKIVNWNAKAVTTFVDNDPGLYYHNYTEYDVSNPSYNDINTRDAVAGLFSYLGSKDFNYETHENGVTVNFGESVEYIPSYLFLFSAYSASEVATPKITAVNFECELTGKAIGNRAFDKLLFLKEIAIPNGVTHIYEFTFYYCLALEEVSLPTSLQYIGHSAFGKCTKLSNINLDMDSLTYIGKESFRETVIKEITIPKGVESISSMAFYESGIEKLTIPEDSALKQIGDEAFAYSTIKELYINCDIETLGSSIFSSCISLDTVILKNLTHVGESMFACDDHLRYFECLDLTRIGQWAFAYAGGYWEGGEFVQILETFLLDSPSDWFFTSNENYTGGNNCDWNTLSDIIAYPLDNNDLFYDTGYYYYKVQIFKYELKDNDTPDDATDDYYAVKAGEDIGTVTDLVLPTEYRGLPVLRVAEPTEHEGLRWYGVFEGYSNFKTITIPKQYEHISETAFLYCDNVTDIYYNAENCSVSIGAFGSIKAKMHIGEDVLVLPSLLLSNGYNGNVIQEDGSIYYDGDQYVDSNISEIIFAENCRVTTIQNTAFCWATELKSLTIPESVNIIEPCVFYCNNGYKSDNNFKLESVKFESNRYWYVSTYTEFGNSVTETAQLMDYNTIQDSAGMVNYFISDTIYGFEKGTPAYEITFNHGMGESDIEKLYFEKYGELGWFDNLECKGNGFTAITAPTVSDSSYIFKGYFTEENGNGEQVVNADGSFTNHKFTADSTIYAYYETVAGYQVTLEHGTATSTLNYVYYAKDGSGWYAERACTTAITKIDVLPEHNLASDGYEFTGYFTATEGGEKVIDANGNFVTDANITIEGPTTLYAQYYQSLVKYELSEDETHYIASARNTSISGEIEIWAEYNGLPVTEIAEDGFYNCVTVTSITIPESITTIGSYAFMGMTALEEVNYEAVNASGSIRGIFNNAGTTGNGITFNIADTVERIPGYLLDTSSSSYDINVKVLNIGKNVKAIGADAFYARDTIEVINYNAINCETITQVTYGGPFRQTGVTDALVVNIGEDVTHIPAYFFSRDRSEGDYQGADEISNLKVVNMGSNVISIGYRAFDNSNLQEIDLETATKLETIGEYAFADCDISTITIPESVKKINNGAFASLSLTVVNYNATNCEDNTEPSIVETSAFGSWSTHSSIFDVTHIGTLNIADNVEHIPAYLFYVNTTSEDLNTNKYSYRTISTINIGTGLKTIGTGAFARATRRTTTININATNLTSGALDAAGGNYGFITTSYETNVIFADNVTNIPASLLSGGNLANVIIGSGITSIGNSAFANASINSILFKDSTKITYIGDHAFYSNSGMTGGTFIGSSALTYVGEDAFFSMDEGNELEMDLSACVNLNTIGARAFYGCHKLTKITIAEGVTSIGNLTFFNCTGLIEINFNAINCADLETSLDYNNGYSPFAGINNVNPITLNIGDKVKRFPANFTYGRYQGDEFTASYVYASTKIETINFADNSVCTTIGDRAFTNSGVTTINWGANSKIESIGARAIAREPDSDHGINPNYLESLTLPETLKTVGDSAFDYQNQVTELTVPESVETIGSYAFYMLGLTKIYFNAINCTGNFKGLSQELELVVGENVTKIDNYFLVYSPSEDWYENNITKITFLGNNLISIGKYAFSGAQKLTEITLPNGLQTIADHAFYNNYFTTITIPASVYQIGAWALHDVYTLQTAIFEITTGWTRGSKYYPGDAYKAISSTNMANPTTAAGYLHDGDPLKREVPSFTTTIVSDSESNTIDFGSNEKITLTATVSAEETATYQWYRNGEIIEGATSATFEHTDTTCLPGTYTYTCMATVAGNSAESNLITITVNVGKVVYTPDNAETPTYYIASASSTDIEGEVNILNEYNGLPVTRIGVRGFENCRSMTSVILPESITSIGKYAFTNCHALEEINYNITTMADLDRDNYVFTNAGKTSEKLAVRIGDNVTRVPAYLFCPSYTYYADYYTYVKTVIIGKEVQSIGKYAFYDSDDLLTEVNFDNALKLETIEDYAFAGSSKLESANLEKAVSLKTIGERAFWDCNLNSINLPGNVTYIGDYAFSGNVTAIVNLENANSLTTIGDYAFANCKTSGEFIIPESVITIGKGAFGHAAGATKLTIGKNVTSIGEDAFNGWSTLTEINFNAINCTSAPYIFVGAGADTDGVTLNITDTVEYIPALLTVGDSLLPDATDHKTRITVINIGKNVKRIGGGAFSDARYVTEINYNAIDVEDLTTTSEVFIDMHYTSVTTITVPRVDVTVNFGDSVKRIPAYLFDDAASKGVDLNFSMIVNIGKNVESIGTFAFFDCRVLNTINLENATSLRIIDYAAFAHTFKYSVKANPVILPESLAYIGYGAFTDSGVELIEFKNTYGWRYTSNSDYTEGTPISSDKLATAEMGATALTTTYAKYYWYREAPTFTTTIVSDSADNSIIYTSDKTIILTASVSVSGEAPTYQWYRNGEIVGGATSATYTHNGLTCEVGSYNYSCMVTIANSSAESNSITIAVTKSDVSLKMFSGDNEVNEVSINSGEIINLTARFVTTGNVLGTTLSVSADKTGATYVAGEITEKQSVITVTAGEDYVKGIVVTVSFAGDSNFNATTVTFILNIQGVITLETNGYGTLTHADAVDNKVVISESGNVLDIVASANTNYGLYYYTIVGKTMNTIVYNTKDSEFSLTGGSFDLTSLTESVIVTAYFVPVINLEFKVTGGELVDYSTLLKGTYINNETFTGVKYSYATTTENGLVATASVMVDENMIYDFGGQSKSDDNMTSAITSVKFEENEILTKSTANITESNGICLLSSLLEKITLEAGETYTVEYTLVTVVSVENIIETDGNASITVNANTVTIDDKSYVELGTTVDLKVTGVAEGYTFIGFKTESTMYFINNSSEENIHIKEDGTVKGQYNCATTMSTYTASMKPVILKNYTSEIEVTIETGATLTLTHLTTGLKYNVTNGSITSSTLTAPVMYGDYSLAGLSTGTVSVVVTYSNGTSKTIEETEGNYLFSINEEDGVTVTKVEITVK